MKRAKVLIACEFSGVVRDAFRGQGHEAVSCDLLPTESPGPHYQGDVLDIINDGWDLMIAHPDCTYLCSSGLFRNKGNPERSAKTEKALDFVRLLMSADCRRIALENPVGCISTKIDAMQYGFATRKATQYVQPYEYGHDASKRTGLWLKGLPPLKPTLHIAPRICDGKPRWSNQTDSGQNRLAPGPDRWKERAKTYQGIADAMARQWGPLLP